MSSIFGNGLDGGYNYGHKNPKASGYKGGGRGMYSKGPEETVEDILGLKFHAIPERGISEAAAKHFGIRTRLSATDGMTQVAHYFPYTVDGKIVGFKKRDLTKTKLDTGHFTTVGFQGVSCDMFGVMNMMKSKTNKEIYITEGEYDAVVLWQVLREERRKFDGKATNPTVVSISNGTSNAVRNLGQKCNMKIINKHEKVVLCFDADKATEAEKSKGIMKGKDATAAVYSLINNIRVADFPEDMDPCDMTQQGMEEQLYWCVKRPIEYVPDGFRTYEQIRAKAHELPQLGRPWPWPTMTRLTLGRRLGEGYFLGAGVKMGKSEWLNQLVEHIIKVEKTKVAVFKFEEENEITCKKVAGKLFHKDFTNAEKVMLPQEDGTFRDVWGNEVYEGMRGFFKQEELIAATDQIGDNIIYFQNYGRAAWDEVKGAIRHAVLVEGAKDVFIDPITRLTQGMQASEANIELERFSDEISKMAKELGFTYYCFCHLNAPERGKKPHEFGGQVQSAQFAGSRAMMRNTYYMLGIERNKDPELSAKERNTSQFVILDDRKHGRAGKFPVFYDIDTGDYLEPPEGFLADPSCQTLREWYDLHPEQKDGGSNHDALSPLSEDNSVKEYSDLTQDDIPPDDEPESVGDGESTEATPTESVTESQSPQPVAHNYDEPEEYQDDDDDAPF